MFVDYLLLSRPVLRALPNVVISSIRILILHWLEHSRRLRRLFHSFKSLRPHFCLFLQVVLDRFSLLSHGFGISPFKLPELLDWIERGLAMREFLGSRPKPTQVGHDTVTVSNSWPK